MDHREIIVKYLKEKSNESEVIALLQEQKKVLAESKKSSIFLNDEYLSLIIKLARNSKEKIKYSAIILLANMEFCRGAKNFYELCRIASESSRDKDGNIRQAGFILIKNLNTLMIMSPFIDKLQSASDAEINLFYESFRNLFYRLYFSFYRGNDPSIRKSVLRSLEIMMPKIYDMAKFWDDKEEMSMVCKIKDELDKGV